MRIDELSCLVKHCYSYTTKHTTNSIPESAAKVTKFMKMYSYYDYHELGAFGAEQPDNWGMYK